jgi:preprotein translocase subunit SecE
MKGYVMSEAAASRLDPLKWGVVVLLIAAGVVGNSYYSDESLLYRVMALIVAAIVAGYVASTTVRGGAFWQLVKGARTEIRKVVWPTRQETTQTTMIVVVFVFVMALILWAMDSVLGWLVSMVIG